MNPIFKRIIILFTLFSFGLNDSFSQTQDDIKQILDLVAKKIGLIVYQHPTGYINKNKLYVPDLNHFLTDNGMDSIPYSVILSLVDKFKDSNNSNWTYLDFPEKVIINKKDTILTYKTEVNRLGLTDKLDKKQLRQQINNFNYSQIKEINYISRPLFEDSGNYAVIQYDNCSNLIGGGAVILLRKVNGKWIDYGFLYGWKC